MDKPKSSDKSSMEDKIKILTELDDEFQNIYTLFTAQKLSIKYCDIINQPLEEYLTGKKIWKKLIMVVLMMFLIYKLLSFESVMWNITAVARMLLIKCLSFCDWTPLYKSQCLIKIQDNVKSNLGNLDPKTNCNLCELFSQIDFVENIGPDQLQSRYLAIHEPVVVSFKDTKKNSHEETDNYYLNALANYYDFLDSRPCDLSTNLISSSEIFADKLVNRALRNLVPHWFFHLRNCEISAVKSVRLLTPHLPFLPQSTPRTHTNWILMSSRHSFKRMKELQVDYNTLVLFVQLEGGHYVELVPRKACTLCTALSFQLQENQCLVFISSIWKLTYKPNDNQTNFAIVDEIYWELLDVD